MVIVRRYCLARCIFSVEGEKSTGQNHEVEYHAGETRRASRRIYIYIFFFFIISIDIKRESLCRLDSVKEPSNYFPCFIRHLHRDKQSVAT